MTHPTKQILHNSGRVPSWMAAVFLSVATSSLAAAQTDVLDIQKVDVSAFKTENGASVSKVTDANEPVLEIVLPQSNSYPGVDLPKPSDGHWDLSEHKSLEVRISNNGPARLNLNLRVDNEGDWRKSPWNTGNLWLDAGKTGTLRVVFGEGYDLDPSKVTSIKLFAAKPSETSTIVVKSIRGSSKK